jgi:6-phosphogluconolactonase (cycloisomerase 2 family)
MFHRCVPRAVLFVWLSLYLSLSAFAVNPIVTVTAPVDKSQTTGPVNYVATATSPGCPQGISAMRIYSAPYESAFTGGGSKINTYINLQPGTYHTVVQAWDYCGNVGKANVTITINGEAQPAGFVYTVNSDYDYERTTSNIRGFTIVGSNGALAPTLQGPVSANVDPVAIVSDKGGYRLYVADYVSGDVFAYFIDRRNGYLNPVPNTPFPANRAVAAVAVHPSGALIFAALSEYAQGDGVAVFQLQQDGSLKEAPGSPYSTQTGPQALKVDPSGNYLYVADGSGYIEAFAIDTVSATLTPLAGSPYQMPVPCGGAYPRDILDPFGQNLYEADAVNSVIGGYTIDPGTGTLTQIAGSPWADDGTCQGVAIDDPLFDYNPRSLAIDGSGKFLYALNELDFNIAIYSVVHNGALNFLKFTPTNSACQGAVRTDPTGKYLYAGACNTGLPANFGGLVGFSINHTTGDLTPLATSPYTYPQPGRTAVQDIAVTP